MEIVIRIFKQRYNVDRDYYEGYADLAHCFICDSFQRLLDDWPRLIDEYEGDTYSARVNEDGTLLCGGALDPDDINYIRTAYADWGIAKFTKLKMEGQAMTETK